MKYVVISLFALMVGAFTITSCSKEENNLQTNQIDQNLPEPSFKLKGWIKIKFGHDMVIIFPDHVEVVECANKGGICKLEIGAEKTAFDDGTGTIVTVDGKPVIEIFKTELDPELISDYFPSSGLFNMPVEKVLSDEICSEVGLPIGYTIAEGNYSFEENEESYIITF